MAREEPHRTLPFSGVLYPNECHQYYDTDTGRKMSLAKSVELSPQRLAILRSNAPRFADSRNDTPFGVYDTDTGTKKTLESGVRDTRRFYSSAFDSKVPRLGRPATSGPVDAIYDPRRTKSCQPNSIVEDLQTTSLQYAIHRSKYKRFNDRVMSAAPDVVYEMDCGSKTSMFTAMVKSPRKYRIVGAPTHKYRPNAPIEVGKQTAPGIYDYKLPQDISISPALENRPLSSMMSRTARLQGDRFNGHGLGSTYRAEVEAKKWTEKGTTISKAQYLRPQYLPKSYMGKA